MTKTLKNVTVKTFRGLKNRPTINKNKTTFVIEDVESKGDAPKGKIYKKYVDGDLSKQIFVTNTYHKKMLKKAIKKAKKTLKNKKEGGANNANPNSKNVAVVMQQPQQQLQQEQQVTGVSGAKFGLGLGFGQAIGGALANGLIGMFSDN